MEYIQYYDEIVKRRESCRNFQEQDVEQAKIDEIEKYYSDTAVLVDNICTDMKIYDADVAEVLGQTVGYNGFLIKAPMYIALFSDEADHYLENAGFISQGLILKLTQLDLAACWLTINDADAATKALGYSGDKKLASFIAFGYRKPSDEETRLDIKSPSNVKMIKSGTKIAPKISLEDMVSYMKLGTPYESEKLYSELESALRAVSHSQSFFNRQPYRIILTDSKAYLVGLNDELTNEIDTHLNYGIAMFNFYAVMESIRANAPKWSFEAPDEDIKLPSDVKYIAKCGL